MARTKSSGRWLREHFNDPYVKRAHADGYRGRAAYKLVALQEKHHLIKPNMTIVDLGAAPGSWSQVCREQLKETGKVFALDILEMEPIPDVNFLQGDFTEDSVFEKFLSMLAGQPVDLILSDMAPNMSGNKVIDQPRSMLLNEMALDFADRVLAPHGTFLTKVFQGAGFETFLKEVKARFARVLICKPDASRARSREQYILGLNYKGNNI